MPATEAQILEALPKIRSMVRNRFRGAEESFQVDPEDMVQTAMAAIAHRAPAYDPSRQRKPDWIAYALSVGYYAIVDELRRMFPGSRQGNTHTPKSLNVVVQAMAANDGLVEVIDTLPAPEEDWTNRFMAEDLIEAIRDLLDHRETLAVKYSVIGGVTQRRLGEMLGVSESRVCQIKREAFNKLRKDPRVSHYWDALAT